MKQEEEEEEAKMGLVVVEFDDIADGSVDLSESIQNAYGDDGYGVIGIRNIPGFVQAKERVLGMAHQLNKLPKEALEKLEDPESLYNAGYSFGKEKMGDEPDFSKASFYFNPLSDKPGTPELREKFPVSYPINRWPNEEMPEFEPAAKLLGTIMNNVCGHLATHIDKFAASKVPNYVPFADAMKATDKAKGRLLYYHPISPEVAAKGKSDSWIATHNDSGYLTCLAGDMYVNNETGEKLKGCPDPTAGLYVVDRAGQSTKVDIPQDVMAIQLGEVVQIITGGAVKATPHFVKGASPQPGMDVGVARISHPVFIDLKPTTVLKAPEGVSRDQVLAGECDKVPPLGDRYSDGMTFGEFLKVTFEKYYEHNRK